jgi:hypothetical protein
MGGAACRTEAAASHRGQSGARRRRDDRRVTDPSALRVVAPVTIRFAFARGRLARDEWEPAYRLSCGRLWWRCLRLAAKRGQLHPCAQRLAKHLSWHLGDGVTLTDIRPLLANYASYHHLSLRTAWTDWGRLVQAGWLSPTRAPANQGPSRLQGPGSGRAARYVLTAPDVLITQLRSRSCRPVATSLDTFSLKEASPSPSVPPRRQDQIRGGIPLCRPTPTQRREASALLAGCHEPWRRQRPNSKLLTRPNWQRLLPLVAQVQHLRPDVPLTAVLTDRVASARSLPDVLAWRLWRLLRQCRQHPHAPEESPQQPTACASTMTVVVTTDWQQHLPAVHALGGPAAVRAALEKSRPGANDHASPGRQWPAG